MAAAVPSPRFTRSVKHKQLLNLFICKLILIETEEERDCERGRYGRHCAERCSDNCNGNDHRVCDSKDGKCLGGCKAGWRGEMCNQGKCYITLLSNVLLLLLLLLII